MISYSILFYSTGTHLCSSCQRTWCPGPVAHCASVAAAASPPSPSPPTPQGSHSSDQCTMHQMELWATYWPAGKTSKWKCQAMDEEFNSSESILKMGKMRFTKPWLRGGVTSKKIYRLKEDQAFLLSLELGRREKVAQHPVCRFPHSFHWRGWWFCRYCYCSKNALERSERLLIFWIVYIEI
jgi:hypothetical protein